MGKRYPLPKFPASIASTFKRLCIPFSDQQYSDFLDRVVPALNPIRDSGTQANESQGQFRAALLRAADKLIAEGGTADLKRRTLIVGALSYLVVDDDPVPDSAFRTGLYDDAKVLNHVLEELGIDGYFVEIPGK